MHALSVQYYEVVQAFRTTTQLERTERYLFLPVTLLNFERLVTRGALARRARPRSVGARHRAGRWRSWAACAWCRSGQRQMADRCASAAGALTLGGITLRAASLARTDAEAAATTEGEPALGPGRPRARALRRLVDLADRPAGASGLAPQSDRASRKAVGAPARPEPVPAPPTSATTLCCSVCRCAVDRRSGFRWSGATASHWRCRTSPGPAPPSRLRSASPRLPQSPSEHCRHASNQHVADIAAEPVRHGGGAGRANRPGRRRAGVGATRSACGIELPAGTRDLLDHLQANALHYTQAVLRSLDGPAISSILARFTFRGLPLAQLVNQRPVAVTSNLLVFRMNMPSRGDAPDPRLAEDLTAWRALPRANRAQSAGAEDRDRAASFRRHFRRSGAGPVRRRRAHRSPAVLELAGLTDPNRRVGRSRRSRLARATQVEDLAPRTAVRAGGHNSEPDGAPRPHRDGGGGGGAAERQRVPRHERAGEDRPRWRRQARTASAAGATAVARGRRPRIWRRR